MNDPQECNPTSPSTIHSESHDVVRARPIDPIHAARPVTDASLGPPIRFPEVAMGQWSALIDMLLVFALLATVFGTPLLNKIMLKLEQQSPTIGPLLSNTVIGAVVVLLVALILAVHRQSPSRIGLNRPRPLHVLAGVAAIPACYLGIIITAVLYFVISGTDVDNIIEQKRDLIDIVPEFSITTVLLFGVFTGFFEELLFRGLLLTRFNALVRNRGVAILLSALCFGMVHIYQGPMGIAQTASIGVVLGIVATMSRSLWPAIIAHAAFNSIQFALMPYAMKLIEEMSQQPATMPA